MPRYHSDNAVILELCYRWRVKSWLVWIDVTKNETNNYVLKNISTEHDITYYYYQLQMFKFKNQIRSVFDFNLSIPYL